VVAFVLIGSESFVLNRRETWMGRARPHSVQCLRGGAVHDGEDLKAAADVLKDGAQATEAVAETALQMAEAVADEAREVAEIVTAAYTRIANHTAHTLQTLNALVKRKEKPKLTTEALVKQASAALDAGMSKAEELVSNASSTAETMSTFATEVAERCAEMIGEMAQAVSRLAMAGSPLGFDLGEAIERVVALAGKSATEIVQMRVVELAEHVDRCTRDERISESRVSDLARRAKCPESEDTKHKRLAWLFAQLRLRASSEKHEAVR